MFCIHCGKEHPDDAVFCIHCGKKVNVPPFQIEAEINLPEDVNVSEELSQIQAIIVPQPQSTPFPGVPRQAETKGTLKIPLLILAALSAVGLLLYAIIPMPGSSVQVPSEIPSAVSDEDTPWFDQFFGMLYFTDYLYDGGEELNIPAYVDGKAVTSIGHSCFYDCDLFTTVILPDTLETIESQAFYDCGKLRGIYIPEGVTYIGKEAFACCTALEAISLPASLEEIEGSAFDGCTSLKYIYFSGTVEQWNSVYRGPSELKVMVTCSDGRCPLR